MRVYTCKGDGFTIDVNQSGDFPDMVDMVIIDSDAKKEIAPVLMSVDDIDRLVYSLQAMRDYVKKFPNG